MHMHMHEDGPLNSVMLTFSGHMYLLLCSLTTLEDLSTSLHSLFENDTTEFYRVGNFMIDT